MIEETFINETPGLVSESPYWDAVTGNGLSFVEVNDEVRIKSTSPGFHIAKHTTRPLRATQRAEGTRRTPSNVSAEIDFVWPPANGVCTAGIVLCVSDDQNYLIAKLINEGGRLLVVDEVKDGTPTQLITLNFDNVKLPAAKENSPRGAIRLEVVGSRVRAWFDPAALHPGDRPPDAAATLSKQYTGSYDWGIFMETEDVETFQITRFAARDLPAAAMPAPFVRVTDASADLRLVPLRVIGTGAAGSAYIDWEIYPADPSDWPDAYRDRTLTSVSTRVFFVRPGMTYLVRARAVNHDGTAGEWTEYARATASGNIATVDDNFELPTDEWPSDIIPDYVLRHEQFAVVNAVLSDGGKETVSSPHARPRNAFQLQFNNRLASEIHRINRWWTQMKARQKSFTWTHPLTNESWAMRFQEDEAETEWTEYNTEADEQVGNLTLSIVETADGAEFLPVTVELPPVDETPIQECGTFSFSTPLLWEDGKSGSTTSLHYSDPLALNMAGKKAVILSNPSVPTRSDDILIMIGVDATVQYDKPNQTFTLPPKYLIFRNTWGVINDGHRKIIKDQDGKTFTFSADTVYPGVVSMEAGGFVTRSWTDPISKTQLQDLGFMQGSILRARFALIPCGAGFLDINGIVCINEDLDGCSNIVSTGLVAGNTLGTQGQVDANWKVNNQPAIITYEFGPWLSEGSSRRARWISTKANTSSDVYPTTTTFDYSTVVSLKTVSGPLMAELAVDNGIQDILVNGVSIGFSLSGESNYASLHAFTIPADKLQVGNNTIIIRTIQTGYPDAINPHGLLVKGIESPCAEPSSCAETEGAASGNTDGNVEWYFGGASQPAGLYSVKYIKGAMKYADYYGYAINAAGHAPGTETSGWVIVDEDLETITVAPGIADETGFDTQAECEAANASLPAIIFQHTGGKIGVMLRDAYLPDNIDGSPNPTFRVCAAGSEPVPPPPPPTSPPGVPPTVPPTVPPPPPPTLPEMSGSAIGFETPVVGNGLFQYAPLGGPWAIGGDAGISGNGSSITVGNPPAPEGNQVLFIQGDLESVASIATGEWSTNTLYQVEFKAACRGNVGGNHDFQFRVGIGIGGDHNENFTTTSTDWTQFRTQPFTVAVSGVLPLVFEGINTGGGDNASLIDDVRVVYAHRSPGWHYGYYTRKDDWTSFTTEGMTYDGTAWRGPEADGTPVLNDQYMHPGKTTGRQAVRRYVVPTAGELQITGTVAKDAIAGDGVFVAIRKNNSGFLYSGMVSNTTPIAIGTPGNDSTFVVGDVIDVVLDPGIDRDGDLTKIALTIEAAETGSAGTSKPTV